MLRPATLVDLPVLRALIREGAVAGGVDRQGAGDSSEAKQLFANLREALATGYFVEKDPHSGGLATIAVPGYVYLPDDGGMSDRPAGFGLFRAAAAGYDLWLTGVDPKRREQGPPMLTALLKTPPGQKAYIVRVGAAVRENPAMVQLLLSSGYTRARETPQYTWYLRNDAPEAVSRQLLPQQTRAAAR